MLQVSGPEHLLLCRSNALADLAPLILLPQQSTECQKSHWDVHRWNCRPPVVHSIRITCDGERHGSPFEPVVITPKHEIYDYGDVCPVSKVVKFPIVMYRHLKVDPFEIERTAALDNQIATYLMIDVDSGFAPAL